MNTFNKRCCSIKIKKALKNHYHLINQVIWIKLKSCFLKASIKKEGIRIKRKNL